MEIQYHNNRDKFVGSVTSSLMNYDKIFLITQKSIIAHNILPEELINTTNILLYTCKENEQCKSFKEVNKLVDYLLKNKCNKKSLLIGIGGGSVTDLSGFVASIYMRGIAHILIPTTLLGMVDASIGNKTAINFQKIRNLIGTFKAPKSIIIYLPFLKTLSTKDCINGYAEIFKYALIMDKKLFKLIEKNSQKLLEPLDEKFILPIIKKCVQHKTTIIIQDEYDNNIRQILNFGHTLGHALESYSKFKISHGVAILYGMKVASYLSYTNDYISKKDYDRIVNIINIFQLDKLNKINHREVLNFINTDKKNIHDKLNYILLKNIGEAFIKNNFDKQNIKKAMDIL